MWELLGKIAVYSLLARIGWMILKGIYGSFLGAAIGLNANLKKMGKWAVVTGATDGIGKAYAFEMARSGLNVVLISRTPFKLQNVAAEITTKYKVETKIIDVDFTKPDIYDRIAKELSNLEIGVLINNVGMSYDSPKYFTEITDKLVSDLVHCNIISLTMMTKIIIEGMQKRKKGLILNVSSLSSLIPAPFLAVYGATKAYVVSFSKSLALEMKSSGVTVQCVTPGFVVSNMSGIKKPSLMAPTPTAYVRSSLKTAGIESCTGGYYMHKLQIMFIELGYRYLFGSLISFFVYNSLNTVRLKAQRKKEREAKAQ